MLAVDTGVLRTIDPLQRRWLEDALKRARGTFTMVLLGHPLYAGGVYQAVDGLFAAIHQLLHDHEVPLVMAGDTHDFEYYREAYQATSSARVDRCDSGFTVSMVHSDGAIYRPEEA